jgi:hypothetical protein
MRTGREVEALRRLLEEARTECERQRVAGPEEAFLQAYVAVKSLELRLDEQLRQPLR